MEKQKTTKTEFLLINPGQEVITKKKVIERKINKKVEAKPREITEDIANFIREKAKEGFKVSVIRGLVKEKFGLNVSASAVYQIKEGYYQTPKGAWYRGGEKKKPGEREEKPLPTPPKGKRKKKEEMTAVIDSVGTDFAKMEEMTEKEIRAIENQVDKQTELTVEELLVNNKVGISPATIIEENPKKKLEVNKMKVTQTPEWKACFAQVKDSVPASQVLAETWRRYRKMTGHGVGSQVGVLSKSAMRRAVKRGWATPSGADAAEALRSAMGPIVKDIYKANASEKAALSRSIKDAFRTSASTIISEMRSKLKGIPQTAWTPQLRKLLGGEIKKAIIDAGMDFKSEYGPVWTPEMRATLGGTMGTLAPALATGYSAQWVDAQIDDAVDKALTEAGVGQWAALAAARPEDVMTDIMGGGMGAIGSLLLNKALTTAFSAAMPALAGYLASGLTYFGAVMLQTAMGVKITGIGEKAIEASKVASIIWLISQVRIGGKPILGVSENVSHQTGAVIPENLIPSTTIGQETLLPEEEEEVMRQVRAAGYNPQYVDVDVSSSGVTAIIPEEAGEVRMAIR